MSKKIHIKEVEEYCNKNGYYIGEYWIPNKTKMSKEEIEQLAEEISFRLLATRKHPEHQWLIERLNKAFNKK